MRGLVTRGGCIGAVCLFYFFPCCYSRSVFSSQILNIVVVFIFLFHHAPVTLLLRFSISCYSSTCYSITAPLLLFLTMFLKMLLGSPCCCRFFLLVRLPVQLLKSPSCGSEVAALPRGVVLAAKRVLSLYRRRTLRSLNILTEWLDFPQWAVLGSEVACW